MQFHRNAKLGLAGRRELVLAIAGGSSIREAAPVFNVSLATAHRWSRRWRQASVAEQRSLSCLFDRSSRSRRSPRRLAPELERVIRDYRRRTGWGRLPSSFVIGRSSTRAAIVPSRPMTGRESLFDSDSDSEDPLSKPANVAGQTTSTS